MAKLRSCKFKSVKENSYKSQCGKSFYIEDKKKYVNCPNCQRLIEYTTEETDEKQ